MPVCDTPQNSFSHEQALAGSTLCQLVYLRVASVVTARLRPLAGPGSGSTCQDEQRRALGAAQPTQKLRRAVVARVLLTLKTMRDGVTQVAVISPTAWPTMPDALHVLPLGATMEPDADPW